MKKHHISALIIGCLIIVVSVISGREFLAHRKPEIIIPGEGVSRQTMLSEWYPALQGTRGDTEVYVLQGKEDGGSMLVLGGPHPNEPSGLMAAVLLIENARLEKGTLYVIPRANNSGFTHNDPQEGSPVSFTIPKPDGSGRLFRFGSRATNPLDQWPDPDMYIHASSGQRLSGNETRNLNRGYPGRTNGTFTEKVCYGITQLIQKENITLTIDLHEASPEYPVINAIVSHERAMPLASNVVLGLEMQDIVIGLEPSPKNLRGLTHRELGDATDTFAVLMESANAAQGRLRGKTDEALILTGKDPYYVKAQKLGRLYVPYDENGHPLEERVGRHLAGIAELAFALTMEYPEYEMEIEDIPDYYELQERGIGSFLK
jgi:hypothetical protein